MCKITLKELGDRLGVDPDNLRYWITTGRLPAGEKIGRERVFTAREATSIRNWVAARKTFRGGMIQKSETQHHPSQPGKKHK